MAGRVTQGFPGKLDRQAEQALQRSGQAALTGVDGGLDIVAHTGHFAWQPFKGFADQLLAAFTDILGALDVVHPHLEFAQARQVAVHDRTVGTFGVLHGEHPRHRLEAFGQAAVVNRRQWRNQ
ncbi:hypothetical protein D3C86_1828380 [compost metagenome]